MAAVLLPLAGHGQIVTLTDNNAVARIDVGSSAGMYDWEVQGLRQLTQQWFWYRIGNSGPELPINMISAPAVSLFSGTRGLTSVYAANTYSVRIDYLLSGGMNVAPGQSAVSDIGETITINNFGPDPLSFHFFQYSDFDLNGQPGGDTVQLGQNLRGLWNEAAQTKGSMTLSETVTSPGANRAEAGFFNQTLVRLNDGVATDLNNNALAGPGDVTWAFQWDFVIAPGTSAQISKDKWLSVLVPEPSALALLAVGVAGYALSRRRKV